MENPNRMALDLVDEAIDFADELCVGVHHLENDAAVVDFGVERRGGFEAGVLLTEVASGGLATVHVELDAVSGAALPRVELSTDHPARSLLACQSPDWALDIGGTAARGTGPARLLRDDAPAGDVDEADFAVLALEADRLPDEAVAEAVADATGVPTSGVFLLIAPAGSIAGGVALAARAGERAMARLADSGYDPERVRTVAASAPVAPVTADEAEARVRSAGAIGYGGRAHLVVEAAVERPERLAYATGAPDGDAAAALEGRGSAPDRLDEAIAPAQVTVDVLGGPTHVVGAVDDALLGERLGL